MWTVEYEHKQRVHLAQQNRNGGNKNGHGIIKKSRNPVSPALLDAAHAMWSFVLTTVAVLVMLMYCVWKWTASDVLSVVQRFQIATINDQVSDWIDQNRNRNVANVLKLRTDGITNIRMLARWPFVLQYAAFVAEAYENRNRNSTNAATLMLVVMWIVVSEMRFVFAMFWKSKFDVNKKNDRPVEIVQMIRKAYRAMYISVNLGSILVCFILPVLCCE